MAQLAEGESHSTVSWMTLVLILLPGLAIGSLLGWSAYLRSAGVRGSRWLIFSPVLFASALLDPEIFHGLITDGTGGGALIVVATALSIGYVLSGRHWSFGRVGCAVVGALGLLMIWGIGGMASPPSTPRGLWVSVYGFVFVLLFGLAAVLPHPPSRRPLSARGWIALGALVGLAWACALRSFMAEVVGHDSDVHWIDTFAFILLPGAVIGALLGYAEYLRRTGGRPGWRLLALTPLLFSAILLSNPFDIAGLLDDGVGGGAIGVPLIAMLGGYAMSGRGSAWPRSLAGLGFLAGFVIWLVVASDVGGPSFSLTTVHGLWTSTLYESLLVIFALAASVPHRSPVDTHAPGDTVPAHLLAQHDRSISAATDPADVDPAGP
jgi:hypothetical protein